MRQKFRGKYTYRVAESMCRLSVCLTFREASEELSRQGIKVSHTTLNKKVCEWSTDLKVLKAVERLLFDGHIPEVATHIRALGTQQSAVCKILEREARYFEKHAKRMQYKAFREKGYQIGSGVIESACQQVVGQRCKQASMRWTDQGLNAILELRCMLKNNVWERHWYPIGVNLRKYYVCFKCFKKALQNGDTSCIM